MALTAKQALDLVDQMYRRLTVRRRDEVIPQFEYYEGKHPLVYATPQWSAFHAARYKGFSDNWCGVVAESPVDRLAIVGVQIGEDTEILSTDERQLWRDWERNELPAQSAQGFLSAVVAKRSSTLVWGNKDDEPVVTWEHPGQVIVGYDPDTRLRRAALKSWVDRDEGIEFATLYMPDVVFKYQRPASINSRLILPASYVAGSWAQRQPAGDDTWPIKNPLGEVPVVEWLNRPKLGMDPISDIEGTAAMQNAANLMWGYLFTAGDYASMAARVVLGADPPSVPVLNEFGQQVTTRPALMEDLQAGRMLFLPGKDDKQPTIDQWEAARLDVFLDVIDKIVSHIAAQTRTPGHYLLSNEKFANLNGDALTAAEVPLVTKVQREQTFFAPSARETLRLMALVRDNAGMAEELRFANIQWKDAAMHSLAQVADAATKDRAVGMSLATVLRTRYGMSPEEVQRELDLVADEQTSPVSQELLKGLGVGGGNAGVDQNSGV